MLVKDESSKRYSEDEIEMQRIIERSAIFNRISAVVGNDALILKDIKEHSVSISDSLSNNINNESNGIENTLETITNGLTIGTNSVTIKKNTDQIYKLIGLKMVEYVNEIEAQQGISIKDLLEQSNKIGNIECQVNSPYMETIRKIYKDSIEQFKTPEDVQLIRETPKIR